MFRLKFLLRGLFFLIAIVAWQTQENSLEFNTPVNAVFDAGDSHQWQFQAYRDDVITLTLTRTDGEFIPTLSLLNDRNQIQAQINGSSDGSAVLTYRIPRFGEYVVQITGQAEGTYTLSLTLTERGRREVEQGTVEYGQPVIQQIDDSLPYHLWTFNGTIGQVVDINVEVLEGDLQPIVALTSPGGVNLGRAEGDKNVRLLAVRLPGNGAYEILVRRRGDNLGFSGTTAGRYRLEVTLRNGPDATTNTLVVDEQTPGSLTLDSPLARYSVEAIGVFMAEVELSRPNCLVDLNIVSGGIVQSAVGQSPLRFPVEFISTLPHTLEITAVNCPNTERIDFVLRLRPLAADLPLEVLPDDSPVYGTSERWTFQAEAGDIIRLTARHTDLRQPLEVRIFAPDRSLLFRSTTRAALEQTLVLTFDGYYIVEVSASQPYLLHKILVGYTNQLLTTLQPAQEQFLDITEITTWRITASSGVITLENPAGEILRAARAAILDGPRIEEITLSQPGRYRVKVYSETSQPTLTLTPLFDFENLLLPTGKAILNSANDFHRWQLPLKVGDLLKLRLENLTPGMPLPSMVLIDQTGIYVRPQYQLTNDSTLELIGLMPQQDGMYTVLVNNDSRGGQLTYRLDAQIENGFTQAEQIPIAVTTPIEGSFIPTASPLPAEDFLIPGLTESDRASLTDAESVSIPNLIRGEIFPNQRRQVWRLNVVRHQMLTLAATSLDNQPAPGLTLLDASGNVVLEHWERETPVNQLLYRTPTASTYYVVVTDDLAGGTYLLDVNIIPNLDETIPSIRDVIPLNPGIPFTGEFISRDETDSYVFGGRANDQFLLAAYHETGDFVPELQLVGPRGNEISPDEQNTFSLSETGLYTLNVSASPVDDEAQYGRYTLLVSLIKGQVANENLLEGTVHGTVTRPFEESLWLFYGKTGESISLLAEPLEINAPSGLSVALADSEGETFYFQQAILSESAVTIREVMLPRTGLYQVNISGSTAGRYRLTLNRSDAYLMAGDHALTYGETVSGVFTQGNIVDRWLLAGSQGDVLAIALRPARGDAASVGFELTAPDGTVIGVGIDNNTGAGARTENIVLPAAGVYTLLVGTPDFQFSGSLVYDLSVERQNRTARSWGTIIPYNTGASGIIYADDTRDVWLFEGYQGDTIQISLTGDGVLQPAFTLTALNPAEQVLLSRTGTATEVARLAEYTLPETGAYAITVNGVSGSTGAYTLNISALQQTSAVTQPLPSGQTLTGNVKAGDLQVWTVEAAAGDVLSLRVEPIRRSRLAPHISILSPAGELLTQETGSSGTVTTLTS
ncbi:MAG: hypothetical protein K8I82_11850, partial [Anaerolineae bacterium]|nr:hypothetical protein [Anaerolineae bacterium]